jgi:hypothetical protein
MINLFKRKVKYDYKEDLVESARRSDSTHKGILGNCCATYLIIQDKDLLRELPVGAVNKSLTEEYKSEFSEVIFKYQKMYNKDIKENAQRVLGELIEEGHNRYKLVLDYVNDL